MALRYSILIVDDEETARTSIARLLQHEGFTARAVETAAEALAAVAESPPDLVLSDVEMPRMDGLELCRKLKGSPRTAGIPVVLMSGRLKDEDDQSEGLEAGADDYVLKPYSPRLMISRVRAVLRRFESPEVLGEMLRARGLELDVQARTVRVGRKPVALTRKEFDLLTTFLRKPGRVLSANYLLETVWGYDPAVYNDPHTVKVHISSLRRKIGALGESIVNLPDIGYRFDG